MGGRGPFSKPEEPKHWLKCAWCDRPFKAKRAHARYCSSSHRSLAMRMRKSLLAVQRAGEHGARQIEALQQAVQQAGA